MNEAPDYHIGKAYTRWHWVGIVVFMLFLAAMIWISNNQVQDTDNEFREFMLNQVKGIARTVNPRRAAELEFTSEDKNKPEFISLNEKFTSYLDVTYTRGIYTIAERNGQLFFGPESYAEDDPMASPPGTLYLEPTELLLKHFAQPAPFVEGPYSDEYGDFISAYAPVWNPETGDLLMMVGMDVETYVWRAIIRKSRIQSLIFIFSISIVLLGGAVLIWRRKSLSPGMQKYLHHGELVYALITGLILTAVLSLMLHDAESRSRRTIFKELSGSHVTSIVNAFNELRDYRLNAIARFCSVSDDLTSQKFADLTKQIRADQSVEFINWIPVNQSNENTVRYPVVFAKPAKIADSIRNFDIGSHPKFSELLENAEQTGLPQSLIHGSVSRPDDPEAKLHVFYPVFESDSAASKIKGFVWAQISFSRFMHALFPFHDVYDGNDIISMYLLKPDEMPKFVMSTCSEITRSRGRFSDVTQKKNVRNSLDTVYPLFTFGRTYAVFVFAGPRFFAMHPLRAHITAVLMGLMITALGTIFVAFIARHRHSLEDRIRSRTQELRRHEELLRATLHSIGDAVISTDINGRITSINLVAEHLTGYSGDKVKGRPVSDILHLFNSRTGEPVESPIDMVLKTGNPVELSNHTALKSRDGTIRQIADSCNPIRSIDGRVEGAVLVFRDVTDDYAQREELRRISKAVESASDAIGISDSNGKHFYQNPAMTDMFGYSTRELYETGPKTLYCNSKIADTVFETILSGNSWSGEVEMVHKNGHRLFVLLRADAVKDEDENVVAIMGVHTDITEKKKTEQEIIKSREQYRLAANGSNDGIWDWDLKTSELFLSPKWKQMIGYEDHELPNEFSSFERLLHPEEKNFVMGFVRKYLKGEIAVYSIEFRFRHKDGSWRWILARGEALRDKNGVPYRMAGSHTDITERKKAEQTLYDTNKKLEKAIVRAEEMARQADSANAAKSEFLANVSHEIRTPMNGVLGMTRMLMESGLTSEQQHFAELAYSSAKSLLTIIDDILDFSKIEAGKIVLNNTVFSVPELLENVAALFAVNAEEKGLELVCFIDDTVPEPLVGDSSRLRQILMNLIGNAVKFTDKGYVTVNATLKQETNTHAEILFTITDTGIGIPKDKQTSLFNPFTQADGSASKKHSGTGLGLVISQQLVIAMNGTIRFESDEGKGSIFEFSMPVEKTSTSGPNVNADQIKTIQNKKILVAISSPVTRNNILSILKSWNMECAECTTGAETLKFLENTSGKTPFCAVLVEHKLTDMNAAVLAQKIFDSSVNPHIPIVLVTSIMMMTQDISTIQKPLFAAVLKKPVQKQVLLNILVQIADPQFDDESHFQTRGIPAYKPSEKCSKDARKMKILLVEDHPVNLLVIQKMLEKMNCTITSAENGKIAVEQMTKNRFDIVLMDVQMPEMNGFEATRIIRDTSSNVIQHDIPIIAMTAHAGPEFRKQCLDAGMTDYLSKPVDMDKLSEMLDTFRRDRTGGGEE